MKKVIGLLLCLLANGSADKDDRIIGGTPGKQGDFPYMAGLRDDNGNGVCGGAILSPRWIISAAHCAYYASPTKVTLGNNTATKQTTYTIENIIPHPDYNPDVADNDIMLVKTSQDIAMKPGSVWPIPVAITSADLLPYTNMTFTGWGTTNQILNTYPIDLQVITYSLWPAGACWKKSTLGKPRQFYSSQTQMCAAARNGTAGACYGDDGGPLVYNGLLYGIASKLMNEPCASGFPEIFTKVSYYDDWLVSVMNSI